MVAKVGRSGSGGLKKATTEAAISGLAQSSRSASSRKVWWNTCTRCNEAGRLVCESNNNTSYLARVRCAPPAAVCKLRRNAKQKNDKRGTRAIPPSPPPPLHPGLREEKGGRGMEEVSEATLENIFLGRSRLPMQIFVFHLSPTLLLLFSPLFIRAALLRFFTLPSFIHLRLRPNPSLFRVQRNLSVSDL